MDPSRNKRTALYDYLEKNCLVRKGEEFTHTSIYDPTASYYISPEQTAKFFELYKTAVSNDVDLYLTEKHRDVGPIVIDLDFRFDTDNQERRYTQDDIERVVSVYAKTLNKYISKEGIEEDSKFDVYVMEKPSPVINKGLLKDGIHIVIPYVVTRPIFQLMLREKVLNAIDDGLKHLKLKNKIQDVVDEAVIERNNWQMYGSKKPHLDKYVVTHIYEFVRDTEELNEINVSLNAADYVEILSIRNKYNESEIKFEIQEEMKQYEELIQKRKMQNHLKNCILSKNKSVKMNTHDDIELAKSLIDLLNQERADTYNDWIRVGWCLRNIDHRLLDSWINFSKKSAKFVDGECEKFWNYMRQDGSCLGIGTLHLWAKQDNPEKYAEIVQLQLRELIRQARSSTEYDVAKVIEKLYSHQFIYDSRNKLWYIFRNHRWHLTDDGIALKRKLPTEVVDEFRKSIGFYATRAAAAPDQEEKDRCDTLISELNGVIKKLKKANFQASIMTESQLLFNIEKIDEKMDSNTHLICFENGVYDLDAMEFRDGRPEDYISITTGNNYIPYDPTCLSATQINTFMAQLFVSQPLREYVMRLLASFLHGNIREERFHVWTGSGSNGKSKCLELFEKAYGEYCCTLPIALLTQKRTASNSASPELSRARCKRFACLQEPGENEKLNIGLMKEMTGGDKLYARGLYREGGEFKPQFKMILTCNHLPVVPSDDGGTWRRIRVVKFESKFCENPDPNKLNEFPIDTELSSRFDEWKEQFMSMLIETYKKMVTSPKVKEPEEVLECTREYQRRNDIIADFLDNAVERNETGFLSITDAFIEFKTWLKEEGVFDKTMRKSDFESYIAKQYGKATKRKLLKGWNGYRLKSSAMDFNLEDEYD
jgi:P4 family phage/plasmid primase-like protien